MPEYINYNLKIKKQTKKTGNNPTTVRLNREKRKNFRNYKKQKKLQTIFSVTVLNI